MFRTCVLTIAVVLTVGPAALAQLPPQPPPISPSSGNDQERAACHPDVMRYCRQLVKEDESDVFAILSCLQTNRPKISSACQQVLASHGE